jgi:hypothetical protein
MATLREKVDTNERFNGEVYLPQFYLVHWYMVKVP